MKDADDKSESIALEFVKELPALQKLIMKDVEAEHQVKKKSSSLIQDYMQYMYIVLLMYYMNLMFLLFLES